MSRTDDLEAINRYMTSQPLNTAAAERIHDEWIAWYDGVSTWLGVSQEDYDHARNLRNQFNLANATTAAEATAAQNAIKNGATSEEMAGGTDRRLATGMYAEPWISADTKLKIAVAGVVVAGLWGLKKYLDFVKPF